jgi:hypothetical protein
VVHAKSPATYIAANGVADLSLHGRTRLGEAYPASTLG